METPAFKVKPFIIALFIVLGLAIIFFFSVLANYIQEPADIPTFTNISTSASLLSTITSEPSRLPTNTSTTTLTPRPTWTLRPSATVTETPTPTPTSTSTLIATLTPVTPAKYNDRYELKPWDLSQQVKSIEYLSANAVLKKTKDTYQALAYAEGEAYIRFPDAIDAVRWRWDRAYNLIRINDPLGITLYSELIQSSIESGQVRTVDLPAWFTQYETRFKLNYFPMPPQPGELDRGVIEIVGIGNAYLWLVETPTGVIIYPLLNDIDFDQPHENAYLYADLTGDNAPELVVYRRTSPGVTKQIIPFIFDLTSTPPAQLVVQDQIPIDFGFEPNLQVEQASDAKGGTVLKLTYLLHPACPAYVIQQMVWNGNIFTISSAQYELIPASDLLAYCEMTIDAAIANWGPDAALSVTIPLLDYWPPQDDTTGHPYPPDAFDQLRFRIAILYALAAQQSEATQLLNAIIDAPTVSESRWTAPAQQFLTSYQNKEDVYIACMPEPACNMRDALRTLVRLSGINDPAQEIAFLQRHGVAIRSSGLLDFNKDGQQERWLIIQPRPDAILEFWILNPTQNGVQAVFVKVLEEAEHLPYYHEPEGDVPVIQFTSHVGFIFKRVAETQEAYIEWVDVEYARPTIILDGYYQALDELMEDADPAKIKADLLILFKSPRFKGDCIAYNICDQFHYTLAFVYDLLGEEGNAIDEYLWVWRNYGKSPYAILARLKLDYFPLPTFTITPLPTGTPGPSRTPTQTITPTATQ